jgi:predicted amidohydrolase
LIDLYGHWFEGSAWGIDPDLCLERGASTVIDAGAIGFINFPKFLRQGIRPPCVRVFAFVNIAACGTPASFMRQLEDIRYSRPAKTISVLEEFRGVAIGVKKFA